MIVLFRRGYMTETHPVHALVKSFEDLLGSLNILREILENPSKKYLKN